MTEPTLPGTDLGDKTDTQTGTPDLPVIEMVALDQISRNERFQILTIHPGTIETLRESMTRQGFDPAHPVELRRISGVLYIVSGFTRIKVARDVLHLKEVPAIITDERDGQNEQALLRRVYDDNLARRPGPTKAEQLDTARKLIKLFTGYSDRALSEMARISHPTIGKLRDEMERSGEVERVTTTVGGRGRTYARTIAPKIERPQPAVDPKDTRNRQERQADTHDGIETLLSEVARKRIVPGMASMAYPQRERAALRSRLLEARRLVDALLDEVSGNP